MSLEPLVCLVRESAVEPEGALVLLHGRGADEADLVPVLDALHPHRDARTRLDGAGLTVDYHEHDGGHQIDPRAVAPMQASVRQRVPKVRARPDAGRGELDRY